jgi:hypothetical protein
LNSGNSAAEVTCEFPGETDESFARPPALDNTLGSGPGEITLQHVETLATAGTISVQCTTNTGSTVVTAFDKLTAIRVGTVH